MSSLIWKLFLVNKKELRGYLYIPPLFGILEAVLTKRRIVEVLATGGFDSTCRLCELSFDKDVEVIPTYLITPDRGNGDLEQNALKKIVKILQTSKRTKAYIHNPLFIYEKQIPPAYLLNSFNILKETKDRFLAVQYLNAAVYAIHHPGIELCYERYYINRDEPLRKMIFANNAVLFDSYGVGYLDKSKADPDVYNLFGNFRFPMIMRTNADELELYRKFKYENMLQYVSFCRRHYPRPCGFCSTCREKILKGFFYFFNDTAIRYYLVYRMANRYIRQECIPKGIIKESNLKECLFMVESILEALHDNKFSASDEHFLGYEFLIEKVVYYYNMSFDEILGISDLNYKRK